MTTTTSSPTVEHPTGGHDLRDPSHQAFLLLRTVFTIAPILMGIDKFTNVLTSPNWDHYLVPWINDIVPGNAHQAMMAVGVIEIIAGIVVAVRPQIGAYVVSLWLVGILVDLITLSAFYNAPAYYDIAVRDFGLLIAALALGRLSVTHSDGWPRLR